MWTLFKLVRGLITGVAALWLLAMIFDGGLLMAMIYGQFVLWPVALLWIVPAIFRQRPPKAKAHDPAVFHSDIAHDNIALDFKRDKVWLRDPVRGERYLDRSQVLNIRTNYDAVNSAATRQRLEFQVRDVSQPLWQVLFQRHSDRWRSSNQQNDLELSEWFARLRAWLKEPAVKPATQPNTADKEYSLAELHHAYEQAVGDEARQTWLVAFDINCFAQGLDAREEWERLGGAYPGPSPDLLRMQGA